jgi:hypothetical protein
MSEKILLGLLFSLICTFSQAQECMGFNMKSGSGFEMNNFDGKRKPTGKISYKIASVSKEGSDVIYTIDMESFNSKGKSEMKSTYKMRCNGSTLKMDARSLISEEQMKSVQDFQMKFTSQDIEYPGTFTVGQELKDASLKGEGTSGPLTINMNMLIANRKVESQEKITVPAGSFDAYKITSDMTMETAMGMKIRMEFQTVSYRAPGVLWDLKTETYRKGKLMAASELSRIY